MLTATTRACHACHAVLPDPPAPPTCLKCGTVALAHHVQWDPRVRYFLAAAYLGRHALGAGRSEQDAWERALQSLLAGVGGSQPNPFHLRFEAPAVECYPLAVTLAVHWRSIGAPITPDLIDHVGRSAGLIAPTFPTRRAG